MIENYSAGICTAYGAAKAGGYTGSYAQFCADLASITGILEDLGAFSVTVSTLPAGSSATASYADGVLSLGIPKGDQGVQGETGPQGPQGVSIVSIDKTGTVDLVDTYTITLSNGNTATFTVTNGEKGDQGNQGVGIVNVEKTSTVGLVDTYTITLSDGNDYTFTVTNGQDGEVTQAQLDAALQGKADKDGVYPDLIAGGVMSERYVTDETPYLYRISGGGVEVGKTEDDTIVGGSVVWNQLIQNGNFDDITNWGALNCTVTASNNVATVVATGNSPRISRALTTNLKSGHVLLSLFDFKPSQNVTRACVWYYSNSVNKSGPFHAVTANTKVTIGDVVKLTDDINSASFFIRCDHGFGTSGDTYEVSNVQLINLTQKYNPTIADYVYSLETATAGAGVAWLKKHDPKMFEYHAYDAGELLSVSGLQSHDMVGFNQWDEEWESGGISVTNGQNVSVANAIRSKNYNLCVGGASYYVAGVAVTKYLFWYDANQQFISYTANVTEYVAPANARYFRIRMDGYGATYNHDICVNLSWDGERDGEYEPYKKYSYPLDSDLILRGIPKLDASNNLYYDGDTYESDGTVTRKYGIVDLGSITWSTSSNRAQCAFATPYNAKLPSSANQLAKIITEKQYTQIKANGSLSNEGEYALLQNGNLIFYYSETTPTGYMLYELAEPTTETAEPYAEYQHVTNGGTEEYVSTGIVPVGHSTKYFGDIGGKVDAMPDALFFTESGLKASRAYTVNQLIVINGQLYKANTSIASGATLTVGTNITAVNLGEIITALLNA